MDNLVICERCGSDACFMQEINDKIKLYHCMGCGFQANTIMTRGSEFLKEQIEILPELYKELMVEDENGTIWMPSTVNIPSKGMVFANGTNKNNWQWAAVKAIPMPEDEKAKFKSKGKEYEWKMDMETLKLYPEHDYIEALSYIGVLPE
jgi:hypothetical protein